MIIDCNSFTELHGPIPPLFSFKYNQRAYLQRGEFLKNSSSIPEKIEQRDCVTVPTHYQTDYNGPKSCKVPVSFPYISCAATNLKPLIIENGSSQIKLFPMSYYKTLTSPRTRVCTRIWWKRSGS